MSEMKNWIREKIGNKETLAYTLGEHGEKFGLYPDGTTAVGASVGDEIDPGERPLIAIGCVGVNNLDMSFYREGWENADLSDEDCIRECFSDGDVDSEVEELRETLLNAFQDDEEGV